MISMQKSKKMVSCTFLFRFRFKELAPS